MKRRDLLKGLAALPAMSLVSLNDLRSSTESLAATDRMPVFFVGHGDPMHVLRDNAFTRSLKKMGESVKPKPNAILVVSAHWLTRGTHVLTSAKPKMIYDFGGFPDEMYKIEYPAPGAPKLAKDAVKLLPDAQANEDWGYDHGTWTVLKHMFPKADVPVFQVSIDCNQPMSYHFELAKYLKSLRQKGVLIVGSGNIVHNLRLAFTKPDDVPYDWAIEFDTWVNKHLTSGDFKPLLEFEKHKAGKLSVPTVDHYVPMIYSLALKEKSEQITSTYEEVYRSLSMRTFRID